MRKPTQAGLLAVLLAALLPSRASPTTGRSTGRSDPRARSGGVRAAVVLAAVAVALGACSWITNYPDPAGPRYGGGSATATAVPGPDTLTVVSFNIENADRVDRALAVLSSEPAVRDADVLLLQEMDARGTTRIADALGMEWVYYPGSVRDERDFGNAVLSRWPIVEDRKLVLPHLSVFGERQRTATAATLLVGDARVRVYSIHLDTPINLAQRERRNQLEAVLRDARPWRHVVIGGDLNSGGLGHVATRRGYAWPTEDGPRTILWGRVDHIFLKGLAVPEEGAAGTVLDNRDASDHRPVWVRAVLPVAPGTRSGGAARSR